jgi:Uma2 family endonuclease
MVRVPDVSFISWELRPDGTVPREPVPDLAPTLAVEVLSEGNTRKEMKRKLRDYFRSGVKVVWFIDERNRTAQIFSSPTEFHLVNADEKITGGDILPGFSAKLASLFGRVEKPKRQTKRKS